MVKCALIEHSECTKIRRQSNIVNTLIEHSSNKIFTSMLFVLEHNTSIMGSMKSIMSKSFGKFFKAFWTNFEHL